MLDKSWQSHYTKNKSVLAYPDENLVRFLRKYIAARHDYSELTALDLGCGSGRHLQLLDDLEVKNIIGIDSSSNALAICSENYFFPLIQNDNRNISLKDSCIDIAIAWGSLHYNHKDDLPVMLKEIHRILADGGHLFATLRSDRDTCMKRGKNLGNNIWKTELNDISGTIASFYNEEELQYYFKTFKNFNYGLIERSIVGDTSKIISHWTISAEK